MGDFPWNCPQAKQLVPVNLISQMMGLKKNSREHIFRMANQSISRKRLALPILSKPKMNKRLQGFHLSL